jgi:hypothetical protein
VLLGIREAGIPIPGMFPVDYIHATDEKEAREMLLATTSQYGEFQIDQLDGWLKNIEEDIRDSLRIVDKEIKLSVDTAKLDEPKKQEQRKEPCTCPACGYEF